MGVDEGRSIRANGISLTSRRGCPARLPNSRR
jgi:hypothetical protein